MWKTFQYNDELFMIKLIQNDVSTVHLTNFKNIWVQSISVEALSEQFQESNPLIDIKIEDVVSEVVNLVEHISEANIEILENEDELQLLVKNVKLEFKIQFKFNFQKSGMETFLKEVTVPLIQTVKHLEECKKMLCNLVHKKDRELEEYKLEKGLISRDDLITEKFDENSLGTIDDKSMMNVFGSSQSFWEKFVQQYGKIQTQIEDVKQDPWNHIKRKRKVYSAKTVTKKGKGINYNNEEK